jgi:hypothetical protein
MPLTRVQVVGAVDAGLDHIRMGPPDIIVLDLGPGGQSGLEMRPVRGEPPAVGSAAAAPRPGRNRPPSTGGSPQGGNRARDPGASAARVGHPPHGAGSKPTTATRCSARLVKPHHSYERLARPLRWSIFSRLPQHLPRRECATQVFPARASLTVPQRWSLAGWAIAGTVVACHMSNATCDELATRKQMAAMRGCSSSSPGTPDSL